MKDVTALSKGPVEVSKETIVSIEKMLSWAFANVLPVQQQRETAAKMTASVLTLMMVVPLPDG